MKLYHYDGETGAYLESSDALPDSAYPNKFTIPAFATAAPPPVAQSFEVAVFSAGAWKIVPDYSDMQLYNTQTGLPVELQLHVGDALPADLTPVDPSSFSFPKWDSTRNVWVEDTDAKNRSLYDTERITASQHLEDALKLLSDNEIRKTIPNALVLSQPDEAALKQFIVDEQDYVDLVIKSGPSLVQTMSVNEPTWPLTGNPEELNVGIFTAANPGPQVGLQAVAWSPATQFNAGQLVYGPNNEGLFVAPAMFTSSPQMQTDITNSSLLSVMPQVSDLRHAPVADIADLAALPAQDYAICKVTTTGDEYVFTAGAVSGDIRDNNNTGFWSLVASPAVGQYRTYTGQIAGAGTADIVIGSQPFNPNFELVFVNGSCRVDSEYSIDWTTGTITLNQAMNVNDTWKVLVMS